MTKRLWSTFPKGVSIVTEKQKEYKTLIKSILSKKRYEHCCNVAEMCKKLAEMNGGDSERAFTAGLLHDIHKEIDPEIMKREVLESGFDVDPVELESKPLWHAIASAHYCRTELGITDEEMLSAIRYHTVGKAEMTLLEKIVYLGDLVSAERDFKDVEVYREYVLDNLDNAMFQVMKWSIPSTIKKGGKIPISSINAYNYYMNYKKD